MSSWLSNPVTVKELRGRMRGERAFVTLTLYLLILTAIITLVYMVTSLGSFVAGAAAARTVGKSLFTAILAVQVFLVTFIGPAFTAGAISGERERQTFDLLRTTLLSADAFVRGKLFSALSYILLLVLVSIPLQSIAFLLGGLSAAELIISQAVILVAAVAYALYGLWCSAVMRRTLGATVLTFGGMLFITFGTPLIAGAVLLFFTAMLSTTTFTPTMEAVGLYGGIIAAATNLPATLIVSEALFLSDGSIFGTLSALSAPGVWLPSPWLLFILFHLLLALFFYRRIVRRVREVSDV